MPGRRPHDCIERGPAFVKSGAVRLSCMQLSMFIILWLYAVDPFAHGVIAHKEFSDYITDCQTRTPLLQMGVSHNFCFQQEYIGTQF